MLKKNSRKQQHDPKNTTTKPVITVYGHYPIWTLVPPQYRHSDEFLAMLLRAYLPKNRNVLLASCCDIHWMLLGNWEEYWFGNSGWNDDSYYSDYKVEMDGRILKHETREPVEDCMPIVYFSDPFLYGLDEGGTIIPPNKVARFTQAVQSVIEAGAVAPCEGDELQEQYDSERYEIEYLTRISHLPSSALADWDTYRASPRKTAAAAPATNH